MNIYEANIRRLVDLRERAIERWEEMASDKFWQKVGFDWMNVVQELLKKPV
jgi:hypothetical protein